MGSLCRCPGKVWETIREASSHATPRGTFVQLSQLAEPLLTDPSLKEWNWGARADLHFKKKKKKAQAMLRRIFPQKSSHARTLPPTPQTSTIPIWMCLYGVEGGAWVERGGRGRRQKSTTCDYRTEKCPMIAMICVCCVCVLGVWNFASFSLVVIRAFGSIEKGHSKTSLSLLLSLFIIIIIIIIIITV